MIIALQITMITTLICHNLRIIFYCWSTLPAIVVLPATMKDYKPLAKKYADKGLVVIGFPCNQFNAQEPGTDAEIKEFCQTNYGIDFLMSKKIEVNGDDAHPLFKYLVSKCDVDSVPWNFTKFIVNKDEIVLMAPHTTPEEIDADLLKILN